MMDVSRKWTREQMHTRKDVSYNTDKTENAYYVTSLCWCYLANLFDLIIKTYIDFRRHSWSYLENTHIYQEDSDSY